MKHEITILLMVCTGLLAVFLTSCTTEYPMRFSVSGDIQAEGMKTPLRLEVGFWNVRMSGKETQEVQPTTP